MLYLESNHVQYFRHLLGKVIHMILIEYSAIYNYLTRLDLYTALSEAAIDFSMCNVVQNKCRCLY